MIKARMKLATKTGPSEPVDGLLFAAFIHGRVENFFIDSREHDRGYGRVFVLSHFKTGCAISKKYHGVDFDLLCFRTRDLFPGDPGLAEVGRYAIGVLETKITVDRFRLAMDTNPQINHFEGF